MFNFKKCLITLSIALPLSMASFAAMTGDEAEALTRQLYSNYKVGQTITVTERGEIFKDDKFHCAFENIETTIVHKIDGDNFEIETVDSDNLHSDCKLRENYRETRVFNIQTEAQEILKFGRYLRETHKVELSLNIDDKIMIFESESPKRRVEIFYEDMTPIHVEAELSQGSSGQRGGPDALSYKAGRPDVKVK